MRQSDNTTLDLAGEVFGLLTVKERAPNDKFGTVYWRCECQCGEGKLVRATALHAGRFFTCGKPECRFWEKVYVPEDKEACWEWTGALHSGGYGVLRIAKKTVRAHVYSFEMSYGPLDTGFVVCHHCDNRKCVNPKHLWQGTIADNNKDMAAKGRNKTPRVILSEEKRQQMRVDFKHGVTYPRLAEKYGVSLSTVGRIVAKKG